MPTTLPPLIDAPRPPAVAPRPSRADDASATRGAEPPAERFDETLRAAQATEPESSEAERPSSHVNDTEATPESGADETPVTSDPVTTG